MVNKRIFFVGSVLAILSFFFLSSGDATAQEMKQRSSSKRGWLGVSIQDITAQMEKAMDLKSRDGALVNEVVKKSPAETAGIKEGDVIVQFAGKNIQDASDLQDYVAGTKPETKVQVVVVRKGEKKNLDVVVGKQSTPTQMIAVSPRGVGNIGWAFGSQNYDGMNLRELNEQLGQYFGVTEGNGVLVWEVEKGSAAEKAGVKAGDVVTMVGKKKIKNLRDVGRALGIYDEGEKAEIEVMRKGSKQTLSLEVQDEEEGRGFHYWYNAPSLPRHRGGVFFNDQSPFQIETPDIDIETLKPDMEKFRLDMDEMKNNLRKQTEELRQRIQRDVRRQVRISVDGSI